MTYFGHDQLWPDRLWPGPGQLWPQTLTWPIWADFGRERPIVANGPRSPGPPSAEPPKTPPKFHDRETKKDTRRHPEREKIMKMGVGEGKKERNFGPATLRAPTLRAPTFRPPNLGSISSPYPSPSPLHPRKCPKLIVAKVSETVAKVGRGQSRSWPSKVVAKVGKAVGQSRSWPK